MGIGADPRLGGVLAGFRLERLLGRGGMGVVYLAEDVRLGRKVALKLLAPELAEDERFRERFLRESRLAASLEHPNIVPIHAAGEADGQLYLAMRYVEGSDLRTVLSTEGTLAPERALEILGQVASALDAAHARGLVHRDVKPANVLLAAEHAYLADFGLTKRASSRSGLTETGQLAGTVDYVAPEQIRGQTVDGRADVYSLTCILYECLAGEAPFKRENEVATLWAHIQEIAPRPSSARSELPAALDPVIARGLAKSPEERWGSCTQLVRAARETLTPTTGALPARALPLRRALALGALALSVAVAAALWLAFRDTSEPLRAALPHSVVAIDPEKNSLAGQAKVGLVPIAAVEAHDALWVANATEHTVTRVDPASFEPGAAVGLAGAPVALVADSRSVLAVTTHYPQSLVRINIQDLTQPTAGTTVLTEASIPGDISLSQVAQLRGELWISVPIHAGNDLVRVAFGNVVARIDAFRERDYAEGVVAGGGSVWAVGASGDVVRVDPRTDRARRVTTLEALPTAMAIGAGAIWVTDGGADLLWRLDLQSGRPTRTIGVGSYPAGVAVGKGSVWVANRADGTVSRVDPATNRVTATIRVGPRPESVSIGNEYVWVTVSAQDATVS